MELEKYFISHDIDKTETNKRIFKLNYSNIDDFKNINDSYIDFLFKYWLEENIKQKIIWELSESTDKLTLEESIMHDFFQALFQEFSSSEEDVKVIRDTFKNIKLTQDSIREKTSKLS